MDSGWSTGAVVGTNLVSLDPRRLGSHHSVVFDLIVLIFVILAP